MRVGILETSHFEGAYPIIKLFDIGENQITIFTTDFCFRQFQFLLGEDVHHFTWILQTDQQSKYDFVQQIRKESIKRNFDLLWLNTVADNHLLYSLIKPALGNTRVVLTIHDINGYFNFVPAFNLKRFVRYIGKRRLLKQIDEFNVVGNAMVNYLKEKLPPHKKVYNIPGCIFEPQKYVSSSPIEERPVRLVVPGSIDTRRRDYSQVFKLLHHAKERNFKIKITLLGGFNKEYGSEILAAALQHQYVFENLIIFDKEIVDQPSFDKVMNQSHLVFLPSVHHTVLFDGVTETYGESICSGNIFDVIKHARPAIIPQFLKIPPTLESSFFRYESVEEIIDFLEKMDYSKLSDQAFSNSQNFTAEALRSKYPELFQP